MPAAAAGTSVGVRAASGRRSAQRAGTVEDVVDERARATDVDGGVLGGVPQVTAQVEFLGIRLVIEVVDDPRVVEEHSANATSAAERAR